MATYKTDPRKSANRHVFSCSQGPVPVDSQNQSRVGISLFVEIGMGSSVCHRWVLRAVAAVAALLAMGWYAPSQALASCGDYVTITSGHRLSGQHNQSPPSELPPPVFDESSRFADREAMSLRLGTTFVAREPARPSPCRQCPSQPSDAPCQGPWCSGNHLPMPVPVPTTANNVEDHVACWAAGDMTCSSEQIGLHVLCDQLHRVHHIFPIFHPPRPI
jgi:hypothetical protein